MSTLLTFLVIIGAYFLGFATAAILSTAKKADEQANKFNPPYNWCGEQAMTKDEADHAQYGD